jgi:guanylate kinase
VLTVTTDVPLTSKRGRLTVLSGPSGVGKSTVIATMRREHPDVWLSVSATTRHPRPGERDGVHYHFVSRDQFMAMVDANMLLEWADYAGNLYGTPREPVERRLAAGKAALLEIDLFGARQVRVAEPEALLVFLAPPSREHLFERLSGRGTEDEETVRRRFALAEVELAAVDEFDVVLVNDTVQHACAELVLLLESSTISHS